MEITYNFDDKLLAKAEKIAKTEILGMGISANLFGFDYLCTAVAVVTLDRPLARHLVEGVYAFVAKKFNTSTYCIERDIRSCLLKTYEQHSNFFSNYLNCSLNIRPTNSCFIATVAEVISLKFSDKLFKEDKTLRK